MSFLPRIVLGSIAAFAASKLVIGVTGFELYSMFVALSGSVGLLAAYDPLFGRREAARGQPAVSDRGSLGASPGCEERERISLHSRCESAPGEIK